MSDCCKLPEPSPAADGLCRRCGQKARSVLRETMESLLKPEARARLADESYFFDRTPSCGVVYFSNEAESYFHKDELTVRVGLKETASPIPLCYCFGRSTRICPRGNRGHRLLHRGGADHRRGQGCPSGSRAWQVGFEAAGLQWWPVRAAPANGRSAERISADAAVDRPALLLRLWWRGGRRGMAIKGGPPHINNGF